MVTVSVRLPPDLVQALDAYVELLKKEMPMANRSDGLRSLIADRMHAIKKRRGI